MAFGMVGLKHGWTFILHDWHDEGDLKVFGMIRLILLGMAKRLRSTIEKNAFVTTRLWKNMTSKIKEHGW